MGKLRFRWGEDPDTGRPLYECNLVCLQCAAHTVAGERCRRNTCMYLPYCQQHMKSRLNLEVRKSAHGLGLFAKRDPRNPGRVVFHANELIAPLDGEPLTQQQLDARYGRELAPYGAAAGGYLYDGACRRGVGQYANTAVRDNNPRLMDYDACNALLVDDHHDMSGFNRDPIWYSWIEAKRDIHEGEEIVAFYGNIPRIKRAGRYRRVPNEAGYLDGRTFADLPPHSTRR